MVILRPTKKLAGSLPASSTVPASGHTALGDWYVNRLVVDRRPLLLLVSSASLLPLLLPGRDVRSLPERLSALIATRLWRLGVDARGIDAESRAMTQVAIGPTIDRSVVGIMVDFAKTVPFHLESGRLSDETLVRVEDLLAHTPCHAGRPFNGVIFPDLKAPALIREKWLTG